MDDLLILETGGTDNLLLETGDNLLLESSIVPINLFEQPVILDRSYEVVSY